MHKIDRSARNLRDWATVGELSDAGVDVHFAAESVDFASRGGRLTADIQAVIAADFIRNQREETIKGLNGRLEQGLYPFKAPVGYCDNGGGKTKTICPVKGPKVRRLFQAYASGEYSIWSLVHEAKRIGLTSHGNKTIGKTTIENIMTNPFYMGTIHIKTRNQSFKGKHEPLIEPALFEETQNIRQNRAVKKATKHTFTYRRVFSCGVCGTGFVPERQKGLVYYRCHTRSCIGGSIREEMIERAVEQKLHTMEINDPMMFVALKKRLSDWTENVLKIENRTTIPIQLSEIERKQEQLLDTYLDGLIDKKTFEKRKSQFLFQEQELSNQRSKTIDSIWLRAQTVKFLELSKSLYLSHSLANSAEKRQMLEILFSNRTINAKNVELEPRNWVWKRPKLASVLVGAPPQETSRRGQLDPFPEQAELLDMFLSHEWNTLCEIHAAIHARQEENIVPDTEQITTYKKAA